MALQSELVGQIAGALNPILSTAPPPPPAAPAPTATADSVAAPVTPPVPPGDSAAG
jgi:hypothetical protein